MPGASNDIFAARGGQTVTKSDSTTYPPTRGIYVGTTGDLAVIFADQTVAVTIPTVPVGILPLSVTKIMSTNTTASGIVALW